MAGNFGGEVAAFYARYRRGYPPAFVDVLAQALSLGAGDVAADVGCGTGQLTIPLARRVRAVVGMDPEPAMLALAGQAAAGQSLANVTWVLGGDRLWSARRLRRRRYWPAPRFLQADEAWVCRFLIVGILGVVPATVGVHDASQSVIIGRAGRKAADPAGLGCIRLPHAASMEASHPTNTRRGN
jgi:SAM-dependent methyltransferase